MESKESIELCGRLQGIRASGMTEEHGETIRSGGRERERK